MSHAADTVEVRWLALQHLRHGDLVALVHVLSPDERARAARLHLQADQEAFIAAHAMLRVTLAKRLVCSPAALIFRTTPNGKPEIESDPGQSVPRFNISHARGLVAVAVAERHDVGVDVERTEPGHLTPDVAALSFAPAELTYLISQPSSRWTDISFAFWTLREAYMKAVGLGFALPRDSFSFTLDPIAIRTTSDSIADCNRWLFRSLRPEPDYALAVAVRQDRSNAIAFDCRGLQREELLMPDWSTNQAPASRPTGPC